MTATIKWNRLYIASDGDDEFKAAVKENLPKLLKLPFETLEVDLGRCKNLGEESFKALSLKILDKKAKKKKFILRVPDSLGRFVVGSGLHALVHAAVVVRMDGSTPKRYTQQIDKSEITARGAVALVPEATEIAPEPDVVVGGQNDTFIRTAAQPAWLVDEEDDSRHSIDEQIIVGREAPSEPVYPIPTISKRHFRIYREGNGFFLEDMRSTNGTYLNGEPVSKPTPLGEGDEIVVAITLKHPDGARRFKFTTTK